MNFFKRRQLTDTSGELATLDAVHSVLEEIAGTRSRNEKKKIIAEHAEDKWFKEVIIAALDPYKMYKVTSCSPYSQVCGPCGNGSGRLKYTERTISNIFAKLNDLAAARGASSFDKYEISWLAACSKDTVKVVNRILAKDLRCGAGIKTFREVFPELPDHSVMLCDHDFEKFKKICGDATECLVSPKLDGVRVWAVMGDTIEYISRNGKTYPNFGLFDTELREWEKHVRDITAYVGQDAYDKVIFDGEAISADRDFDSFVGNARKQQNTDNTMFEYHVFDIILLKNGQPLPIEMRERARMLTVLSNRTSNAGRVLPVQHRMIFDWEQVWGKFKEAVAAGEEGLVLKYAKGMYTFGRTAEWCKLKRRDADHDTLDLPVIGMVHGTGEFEGMLGALICDFNGVTVKVGTGFTVEQRSQFFEHLPKMVEVDYQEVTKDGSLRFPVFIKDRTNDKYIPEDSQEE